jgi:hypothetical protein
MIIVWLIFAWAVEQFGREVASTVFFAIGGVVLAVVLWIGSGAYTAAVWREAHRHTETSARMTTELLRSTMPQQRVESTAQLVRERQLLLAMRNSRQLPPSAARQAEDAAVEIEVVEWK